MFDESNRFLSEFCSRAALVQSSHSMNFLLEQMQLLSQLPSLCLLKNRLAGVWLEQLPVDFLKQFTGVNFSIQHLLRFAEDCKDERLW